LTVDAKGNPLDPVSSHCERDALVTPALKSLMASKYKAGSVAGKSVAIRFLIHLEYGDFPK
jgi:hypothetical protein